MSNTFFLTSDLLHQESSIYVGLLAYMRTHARQHLKLEVKHKNSHERIHTHILNGQTHAHKHSHTCMHACTHTQTHIHTIHTRGMYACACIHTVQTQIRRRILWRLIRDSTVCFNNNLLLCEYKKSPYIPIIGNGLVQLI